MPPDAPLLNCNQAVAFIRLNSRLVNLKYVFYACQSQAVLAPLLNVKKVGTIGNLNLEQIGAVEIPLPPLSEQQRLAALLDKADHLRRTRRYAQQLSDTFLQSVFLEMFGDLSINSARYDMAVFDDVVASSKIGLVRSSEEMKNDHPYAYVRMDAIIGDGTLDLERLRRVKATPAEVAANSLQPSDFLFNTRNSRELVGKTALFTQPGLYLFNNNILQVRFKETVAPEYMTGLFQTQWAKQRLEKIKAGTTSVFAIYYKDLRDLPIILPPLPLQQQFAQIVGRVERLRAQQREAARQAEHLFQTLLHRAFRGEV